jgi:uncharacterized membrane protein YozB (DUF420 family)
MMLRNYIQNNIASSSILLFVILYVCVNYYKPSFLYNTDGSLRNFGINNSKKTVIPIWLITIIIALMSYLFILYYIAMPKIIY